MIENEINYHSFLLRIWHIPSTHPTTQKSNWVCEVESIQSGETWKAKSLEAMFALLRELAGRCEDSAANDGTN